MTLSSLRARALATLGAFALIAGVVVPTVQVPAGATTDCGLEGEGDANSPYLVKNAADLAKVGVGDCGLGAHYRQTADIVLVAPAEGASNHTPIGTDSNPFNGVYDGADKAISGMTIESSATVLGMFTATGADAILRNVRLVDIAIVSTSAHLNAVSIGGLVGRRTLGRVIESSATGSITLNSTNSSGGLVGWLDGTGEILRSFAAVDIVLSDAANSQRRGVGGLVGLLTDGATIAESFATGDVAATEEVGGLVGRVGGEGVSTIRDSYARGTVTGDANAGGLVGILRSGSAYGLTLERSYSTGEVVTAATEAGLIGGISTSRTPTLTITASFWDAETSKKSSSAGSGATGKSTADMKDIATFTTGITTEADRWPIAATCERGRGAEGSVWGLCATINDGYPFLRIGPVEFPLSQQEQGSDGTGGARLGTAGASGATPVLVGGDAPSLEAGTAVLQAADGTSTPLAASSPAPGVLRYTADGVTVTLTGAPGTSVANGLVADANGEVICEVCVALAAGQVIEAWMFSEPRLVAAHRIEDLPCQRFSIPVVAPLDGGGPVSAGAHTLQLALPTSSGMQAVNVGVTVGGPVPASVPAGEGPVPSGAALLLLLGVAGALLIGRWALAVR